MDFISPEKILKVLLGYNPWWSTGQVPREFTKPIKRLAFYQAKKILAHPSIRREIILSGPRRVGKTTILYQLIEEQLSHTPPRRILYVSFDHPMLKLSSIGDIIEVYQNNIARDGEELYLFFDEIQYANDWDRWLKTLYDSHPNYKVVATGSASPVLIDKASESGVGRWTLIRIPTLSFYEYIELMQIPKPTVLAQISPMSLASLTKEEWTELMISLRSLQKHFHQYLLVGGFPEVALANDVPYAQKVIREDVVDKVLKRDMITLFNIRNVAELEKIFLYLCMTSGNIIVQDTIAKEIGVSRPTVANYMELLEQGNLIYISMPAELTGKRILKSRPKVYVADAAIRNAVLMLGEEVLTDTEEMGMIIETAIYKHIHSYYDDQFPQIGYYRDAKTEKEIDVVVSFPLKRMIIEVKYKGNTHITEKEAIVEWANDEKTSTAILITKNAEDYGVSAHQTKTPIVKIPAFAFLYLLGYAEHQRSIN